MLCADAPGALGRDARDTMSLPPLRRSIARRTPTCERFVPGSYVTDGCRLLRVISPFAAAEDRRFASLEDCLTLEVQAYSPRELATMGLQPVPLTPAQRDPEPAPTSAPVDGVAATP